MNTSAEARLGFSADTLRFDTVFTATGSISQLFKIRNGNEGKIRLSTIRLMGGNTSSYALNINGVAANQLNDIELEGNDSMYVFVTVTINPSSADLPFLVQDSILIAWNGNEKYIQLEAFGQNANFIRNGAIVHDTVWSNSRPFVIIGPMTIDSGVNLTVEAGSRLYFHADAPLLVKGSLQVQGTESNRVSFYGDRLDDYYRDLPGSWPGIYFLRTSRNNLMRYAVIRNSLTGISMTERETGSPKLVLQQCIIDNSQQSGIDAKNSSLRAENCLISNCGGNLRVEQGGQYDLLHCTLSSFSTLYKAHSDPAVFLSDADISGSSSATFPLQAYFTNCIFWGSQGIVNNEVTTDKRGTDFSVTLDHCLLKAQTDPANSTLISLIRNNNPAFDSIDVENNHFDFHITRDPAAPGINAGTSTSLQADLDGRNRNVGLPDLGCYEKQ